MNKQTNKHTWWWSGNSLKTPSQLDPPFFFFLWSVVHWNLNSKANAAHSKKLAGWVDDFIHWIEYGSPPDMKNKRIGGTWLVLTHLCKISHQKLYRLCTGRRPPCRLVLDPPDSKLYWFEQLDSYASYDGFRHRSFSQCWSHLPNYLCVVETGVATWGENSPVPNLRGVIVRPKINWGKLRGNINLHPGLIHQISTCFKICGVSQVVLSASVWSEYNSWRAFAF